MLKRHVKLALFLSAVWLAQAAAHAGELTLFSRDGLQGRELNVRDNQANLEALGFNDRAESMVIYSGRWEICEHAEYRGDCRVFEPGEYHSLDRLGNSISSLREVGNGRAGWRGDDRRGDGRASGHPPMELAAPVILFDGTGMRGRSMPLRGDVGNLTEQGFNDRTQSIVIEQGSWEFCVHNDFRGECRVFGPGQYRNLDRAFHRSITSVRQVQGGGNRRRDGGNGRRDGDYGRREGVELFGAAGFDGDRMPVRDEVRNLNEFGFNDRAGSLIVYGGQWEFCEHADFRGQCLAYGPGRYDRLGRLHNQISSIRRVR